MLLAQRHWNSCPPTQQETLSYQIIYDSGQLRDPCASFSIRGDIIIPVDMRTDEVQISTGGLSTRRFTAKVECHQFELAFVSTVHKSQGSTLKKVIISLLNRPFPPRRNDWHAIYVALTRVRSGDDLRVLADAADLNFLDHLRPPADLLQFIAGYHRMRTESGSESCSS